MGYVVINYQRGVKLKVIDTEQTGKNIIQLQRYTGHTVGDLQAILGLSTPQAIYKWRWGKSMPTLDNLVILADVFGVLVDDIIAVKEVDSNASTQDKIRRL